MELMEILTLYGGTQMANYQALSTDKVNLQALPPHIHEFLNVSASYLGVRMDSQEINRFLWHDEGKIGVKQNDQEVGYATDYI